MPALTGPNHDLTTNQQYRQIMATTNACKKAAALIAAQPLLDRNSYVLLIVQTILEAEPFGDFRDDMVHRLADELDTLVRCADSETIDYSGQ